MFGKLFDFLFSLSKKNDSALAMVLVKVARTLFLQGCSLRSDRGRQRGRNPPSHTGVPSNKTHNVHGVNS